MLEHTKYYAFKLDKYEPFSKMDGLFYWYYQGNHVVYIDSKSQQDAEVELWSRDLQGTRHLEMESPTYLQVLKSVNYTRNMASVLKMDLFDDGFEATDGINNI